MRAHEEGGGRARGAGRRSACGRRERAGVGHAGGREGRARGVPAWDYAAARGARPNAWPCSDWG